MRRKLRIPNPNRPREFSVFGVVGATCMIVIASAFCHEAMQAGYTGLSALRASLALFVSVSVTLGVCGFFDREDARDKTDYTCPGCDYCLRGNTSRICPECGRGFSFSELGTTREEFLQEHSASATSQDDPAEAPEVDKEAKKASG